MVFLVLFTLVFAIVEFGLQFKDSLAVTNAVRAGARTASAATRQPGYNVLAVDAVTTGQAAVGASAPQELLIYKAEPATGYPVGDPAGTFDHRKCTYCEWYTWRAGKWTCMQGCDPTSPYYANAWPGADSEVPGGGTSSTVQYSCLSSPQNYTPAAGTHTGGNGDPQPQYAGPDSIGVYLKISHKNMTGFFGDTKTITDHAVSRLEPVALDQSCYG